MISVVRPSEQPASPSWMRSSTCTSMALVASSRTRMGGLTQQGAGDGDALALAAGQGVAPLAHDRVVAVGELADELVGAGGPGGGLDVGEIGHRLAVGDVVPDRQ